MFDDDRRIPGNKCFNFNCFCFKYSEKRKKKERKDVIKNNLKTLETHTHTHMHVRTHARTHKQIQCRLKGVICVHIHNFKHSGSSIIIINQHVIITLAATSTSP